MDQPYPIGMDKNYHIDNLYINNPLTFGTIKLNQIGRLYGNSNTVIDRHLHLDFFELTIVLDGEGVVYTNDIPSRVRRGDIYLSFPCDAHMILSDPQTPIKYDFFSFSTEDETLRKTLDNIVQLTPPGNRRIFQDNRVSSLISNAIEEFCEEYEYREELLTAAFRQVLIYIIRNFNKMPQMKNGNIKDADMICYRITNYIDTHIFSIKNLNELSELTGYNYSYLSALFKKHTGGTIFEYFHEKKMNIAKELLSERNMKISQIANHLNYTSVYAFSKAFHNKFGVYPQQYAKNQENDFILRDDLIDIQ